MSKKSVWEPIFVGLLVLVAMVAMASLGGSFYKLYTGEIQFSLGAPIIIFAFFGFGIIIGVPAGLYYFGIPTISLLVIYHAFLSRVPIIRHVSYRIGFTIIGAAIATFYVTCVAGDPALSKFTQTAAFAVSAIGLFIGSSLLVYRKDGAEQRPG